MTVIARQNGERLVRHLREAHSAQLGDTGLIEGLDKQAASIHAAMHSGRAHPGHFHYGNEILHLWDLGGRIRQVDTRGRT